MKKLLYFLIPAAIVGLDQWMKAWTVSNISLYSDKSLIPGFLGLTHRQNTGAAFGVLPGLRWLLVVLTCCALLFMVIAAFKGWISHPFGLAMMACIWGGALGNFIDRASQGYVVDMFEFTFVRFAIFNVADVFIVGGGIAFCVYWLWIHDHSAPKAVIVDSADEDGENEDTADA